MRTREAKHGLPQIYLAVLETCAPSKTSASSCVFLPLYAISSSLVRSSCASVVASLWRSLLSREPVMMGPQHLHRLLFPSRYFLLCYIMRCCPTSYTRCCSLYCASRCAPCQHSNNCAADTSYTVIIVITGTPTSRRTETHPGKPGAQTPFRFLREVWVPRLQAPTV